MYIDLEKLRLIKGHNLYPHGQMAATVAVVNSDLKLIFWCFVSWKPEEVCSYVPTLTNITAQDLADKGVGLEMVRIANQL